MNMSKNPVKISKKCRTGKSSLAATLVLLMLLTLSGQAWAIQAQVAENPGHTYQEILDELVDAGAAGAVMLVDSPVEGTWMGSSGYSRVDTKTAMTTDCHFRIGSITKTFTATVIMQMVEEGRLNLNDSVEKWLPGLVPDGNKITINQLLNHTSGLYDYSLDTAFQTGLLLNPGRVYSPEELVGISTQNPLQFNPGDKYAYSSTGYILLGMIIEKVSGSTVAKEIDRRIIKPLGLSNTTFPQDDTIPEPYACGYRNIAGVGAGIDVTAINPSAAWTAGAIISTAQDLLKWSRALGCGDLISPASRDTMFTWQDTGTDTLWTQYGLGIEQMFGTRLGIVLGHGGDVPGYRTIMCYFPGYDTSLILLCNQNIAETAIIKCLQETMAAIPVNNVVSAGMENNRQTITMIEGQTLRIALASNPSTGYDWKYKENNPDFLIKKSAFYVPDDREGIITGGGGTSYWLLEAVQPGTTSLSLEYTSVSGSVDDTYSLGIEITAKPDSKFLSPWRERTCDNDVKADKEWAIRFNQPVARSTVNNNNIYVVDSEGNKVENNVDLDTKGNVRLVIVSPPESGYESGGTYTLYIKPDVANLQGQTLKNGIKMSFNIAGQ